MRDAPELLPQALPFLSAFNELVNSRQVGMGKGPIPYTEVIAWVNENDKIGDIRIMYIDLIQYIDVTQLNIDYAREEAKNPPKK